MTLCDLTELDRSMCSHCRQVSASPVWSARYNTTCRTCSQPIDVGELVRWAADGQVVQHAHHR